MAYYIQANPGVLMILVRHGATTLNNSSKPVVRGWQNVPLEASSVADVQMTANKLRQYDPKAITSSDFMRDSQTKQIIAATLGIADASVDYDARTWDVGEYSGKPEDEVNPAIMDLYQRPYATPPGSLESFSEFSERWIQLLDRQMARATVEGLRPSILVTHGRNIALTDSHFNFKLPEDGLMPMPSGFGVLSISTDRRIRFDLAGETECVCVDI